LAHCQQKNVGIIEMFVNAHRRLLLLPFLALFFFSPLPLPLPFFFPLPLPSFLPLFPPFLFFFDHLLPFDFFSELLPLSQPQSDSPWVAVREAVSLLLIWSVWLSA